MIQETRAGSREKIIARMRKILALAENGQGGERSNAQAMLDRMLKKHGVAMDELTSPDMKVERRQYGYRSVQEKHLLAQIIVHVLECRDPCIWTRPGTKDFLVDTTMGQDAQIRLVFGVLKRALRVELERTLRAFVCRHELFGPSTGESGELDAAQLNEARAIRARMAVMDRTQVRPALQQEAH